MVYWPVLTSDNTHRDSHVKRKGFPSLNRFQITHRHYLHRCEMFESARCCPASDIALGLPRPVRPPPLWVRSTIVRESHIFPPSIYGTSNKKKHGCFPRVPSDTLIAHSFSSVALRSPHQTPSSTQEERNNILILGSIEFEEGRPCAPRRVRGDQPHPAFFVGSKASLPRGTTVSPSEHVDDKP